MASRRRGITPRNLPFFPDDTSSEETAEVKRPIKSLSEDGIDSKDAGPLKAPEFSLSKYMWENSTQYANDAMETQFLHGIRHGSLHPEKYGAFGVQDAAYCNQAVKDYQTAIDKAECSGMLDVANFLKKRRDGYVEYLEDIKETWHLGNTDDLVLSKAVKTYIDFERKVAELFNPIYLVVAMIPCSRLWFWLANNMLPYEGPANVYSFWIRENKQGDGGKKLEDFVDKHSSELDRKQALSIYQAAIVCEGNFMRSACGQTLRPFPKGWDDCCPPK